MSKFPEFEELVNKFPSIIIESYGGVAPLQCEGLFQGESFYFRLRHGIASLSYGGKDVVGEPEYYEEFSLAPYYDGDGYIEPKEFVKVFTLLLDRVIAKSI